MTVAARCQCSLWRTGVVVITMIIASVDAFVPNTNQGSFHHHKTSICQRIRRSRWIRNSSHPPHHDSSSPSSSSSSQSPTSSSSSDAALLPPNCQIYLPSFAFTTTLEETPNWEWILWENQPLDNSVSLVSSSTSTTLTPRMDNPILAAAATAAWETWRWCANVVVPLQLCPWAASSVQTPNAIRLYLVVESPTTASIRNNMDPLDQATIYEQRMQQSLARAVQHWWRDLQRGVFGDDDDDDDNNNENNHPRTQSHSILDPKTAIAFCVDATSKATTTSANRKSGIISVTNTAAFVDPTNNDNLQANDISQRHVNPLDATEMTSSGSSSSSNIWDFDSFYDWYVDLEEHQNWWRPMNSNDLNVGGDDDNTYHDDDDDIAEQITLAPFHPDWQYYSDVNSATNVNDDDEDKRGNEERGCWAFEKKSPHPTISMVASAVVEQAGAAVTERIAINNAEILTKLGTDGLSKLYRDQVWL